MSVLTAAERRARVSPRLQARVCGVLFLLIMIGSILAPFGVAPSGLMIGIGSPMTPARILASRSSYVLGGFILLLVYSLDIVVAIVLYELLEPVSKRLALVTCALRVVFAILASANLFNHFAQLALLSDSIGHGVFTPDQLQALAMVLVRLRALAFDVALVFFGMHCLFLGYLLFKSTFFPRVLGVGLAIAGLCYLANFFAVAIPPALASRLFPYALLPAGAGEIALTIWLIAVGLNSSRWEKMAEAGSSSAP